MTYSDEYPAGYDLWSEPADASAHYTRALRGWLYATMLAVMILVCRDLLWTLGLPVPLRIMSAGMSAVVLACLLRSCALADRAFPHVRAASRLVGRLNFLIVWIFALAVYGFMRGNAFREIYKESCGYLICIFLIRLAMYDEAWRILLKPLLIITLMGAVLIVATAHMPGVQTSTEGTETIKEINVPRNLASLGFTMRSLVSPGLLLGAWGLVAKRADRWKALCLIAFLTYAVILGGLFEFRGVIITVGGVLIIFVVISPVVSGRIPLGTIIAVTVLIGTAVLGAVLTGKADEVMQRFSNEQIFGARISETQAFFSDMGPIDLVIGRGMGGYYNGPEWAPIPLIDGQRIWNSNHFGILSFVLRGGFALLLFIVVTALPIFWRRTPVWYTNELNLAATILAPLVIWNLIINPASLVPENILDMFVMAFCFGRFAVPAAPLEEAQ